VALNKPYYRIIRPFKADSTQYTEGSSPHYPTDSKYASDRIELCRAYQLIEKDLLHLFEYINPCDDNLKVYSHRTYELLLRTATEFETNCKRILEVNGYNCPKYLNMMDYFKIHQASKLGDYKINLLLWHPTPKTFQPFQEWAGEAEGSHPLSWYQAYNAVKHDRNKNFGDASLKNVLTAISGLKAIIFSQFFTFTTIGSEPIMYYKDDSYGFSSGVGEIFTVVPYMGWKPEECYDFDWKKIKNDVEPFEKFSFK